MDRLLISLLILFTASIHLNAEPTLKWLGKNTKDVAGKQFLAVVKADEYTAGDYAIVFGNERGGLKLRSFVFDNDYFYPAEGNESTGEDDFYKLKLVMTEQANEASVTLNGRKPGYDHQLTYQKDNSTAANSLAVRAVNTLHSGFEVTEEIEDPETLSEFKKMLDLMARRVGSHMAEERLGHFPLPDFALTIDFGWHKTPPNPKFASTQIKKDASDPLSKWLKIKKWVKEEDVLTGSDNESGKWFNYFREKSEAFTAKPFKLGAKKFIRYEVVSASTFPCEDFYIDYENYNWILVDGSTFSYEPSLECD